MAFKARIAKDTAPSADRFILCGRPGVGKTYFTSTIPNTFLLFVEDGSKGIAPGHEPDMYLDDKRRVVVPRTLAELLEAIDGVGVAARERSIRHLALDSFTDIERLVHLAACGQERVSHMEGKEYKKVWAAAVPHWLAVQRRLERIRTLGVHVWLLAHSTEAYQEELSTGESWRRLELAVAGSGTTAAESRLLWTRWADHVLFLDFAVSTTKKRKKTIAEYRGRILYTRESASHFAKSRAEVPATIPATWEDLQIALKRGTQASDRRLRARLATALEQLEPAERASVEAQVARAKSPQALSAALSRAESLAAVAAREAAEDASEEPEEPATEDTATEATDPPAATEPPAEDPAPELHAAAEELLTDLDQSDPLTVIREASTTAAVVAAIERVNEQLFDESWQEATELAYGRLIDLVPAGELNPLAKQISELALTEDRLARLRQAFTERKRSEKGAA